MKCSIETAAALVLAISSVAPTNHALAQEQRPVERQILFEQTPSVPGRFGASADAEEGRLMVGHRNHLVSVPDPGRLHFFVLGATGTWVLESALDPTNDPLFLGEGEFGHRVALGGGRGLTSGSLEFVEGSLVGHIGYVTSLDDGEWRIEAALTTNLDVEVGAKVLALDIDGDRAVITIETDPFQPVFPGSRRRALVFEREPISGEWFEAAILEFPEGQSVLGGSDFGRDVAIQGDDLFVSDPHVVGPPSPQYGAVFRYRRDASGAWNLEQRLVRPDPPTSGPRSFGESIALDGERIVIAAPFVDPSPDGQSGLVYTFERLLDGSWNWFTIHGAPAVVDAGAFGADVDLEGDVVAVATGVEVPVDEVLVFRIEPDRDWTLVARVSPDDDLDGSFGGSGVFGRTLAVTRGAVAFGNELWDFDPPGSPSSEEGALWSFSTPSLIGDRDQLSLTLGGTQELSIDAGRALAGGAFVVLGSLTGIQSSVPMPFSKTGLPLTLDPYTDLLLAFSGAGLVSPMFGVLDGEGRATVGFTVPSASPLELLGVSAWHAAILYTPGAFELYGATNAKSAWLLP